MLDPKPPWWRRRSRRFYLIVSFGALALFGATLDDPEPAESTAPTQFVQSETIERDIEDEPQQDAIEAADVPVVAESESATAAEADEVSEPEQTPANTEDGVFEREVSAGEVEQARGYLDSADVVPELSAPVPYRRGEYQDGWGDADGDCFSDRHEILIERSEVEAATEDCKVVTGQWTDPYDGTIYTDARLITIDHFVPLSAAHRAGGWAWDIETKRAFAGDIAYKASHVPAGQATNEDKADSEPHLWRPVEAAWCGYALDWISVKERWGLAYSEPEADALREMLGTCEGGADTTAATTVPPADIATSTTTSSTTTMIVPGDGDGQPVITWCRARAETVEIVNLGGELITLKGWVLHDRGRNWETNLDRISLGPGQRVVMLSGEDTLDAPETFRWADRNVWNNDGDTATLLRRNGTVASEVVCST